MNSEEILTANADSLRSINADSLRSSNALSLCSNNQLSTISASSVLTTASLSSLDLFNSSIASDSLASDKLKHKIADVEADRAALKSAAVPEATADDSESPKVSTPTTSCDEILDEGFTTSSCETPPCKVDAQEDSVDLQQPKLMPVLLRSMAASMVTGGTILNARQVFLKDATQTLGDGALMAANKELAMVSSVGSLVELFLSPLLGRISDKYGRRKLYLLYTAVPTLTRFLAVAARDPRSRIKAILLDQLLTKAIGISPMFPLCQTMISDAVPLEQQPSARSKYLATQSLGIILGSSLGGWCNDAYGPVVSYLACAVLGAVSWADCALSLPETNSAVAKRSRAAPKAQAPVHEIPESMIEQKLETTSKAPQVGAIETKSNSGSWKLLRDPQCAIMALMLGCHDFMWFSTVSEVSTLVLQERLGWSALQLGRFSSAYGISTLAGSLFGGKLVEKVGTHLHVSLTNIATAASFFLWGTASGARQLLLALMAASVGHGRQLVLQGRFVERASALGVGKGEAMAAVQLVGAVSKTVAPVALMRLLSAAVASWKSTKSCRLPLGLPLIVVGVLSLILEVPHLMLIKLSADASKASISDQHFDDRICAA